MKHPKRISKVITALALSTLIAVGVISFSISALHQSVYSSTALCLQPPQNVDLTTLSDSALQSYGLPTHAVINQDPIFWHQDLAHAKHRICSVGTTLAKTHFKHHFAQGKAIRNYLQSPSWADNQAIGARGTYRAAEIEFNVPTISLSDQSAAVSIWTGVGGDERYAGQGSSELPQVGVSINPCGGRCQYNESWWEVAGWSGDQGEVNLPLNRLIPGDRVYAYVSSNLFSDDYDYFEIENATTNYYNDYTLYGNAVLSDSATGECVVERPSLGGSPVHLAEFNRPGHTEELDNCNIYDLHGTANSVGNWTHTDYHMVNGSKELAKPEPLFNGGQDFQVLWEASS